MDNFLTQANDVQNKVVESLSRPVAQKIAYSWVTELIDSVTKFNSEDQYWQKLQKTVSEICQSHPESFMPFEAISKIINKIVAGEAASDEDKKVIGSTSASARILNRDHREVRRRQKCGPQNINMRQVYVLGENGFYGFSCDFTNIVRFSEMPTEIIEELEKQKKDFSEIDMKEMANYVNKNIDHIKEKYKCNWHGFFRLRPDDAAVMLARMHGFMWHDMMFVVIQQEFFKDKNYWVNVDFTEKIPEVDTKKKKIVLTDKKVINLDFFPFAYQPRLYPLGDFYDAVRDKEVVNKIIHSAENLSDMNGHPAFDYYWAVVPGISCNNPSIKHPDGVYRVNDGKVQEFKDEISATKYVDFMMVRDKSIVPAILGERDGKCYFLGMLS